MAKRIGGARRKSRSKLKKHYRSKGKLSLKKFFEIFNPGDKVILKAEPSYHKGMYNLRFHGKIGVVVKKLRTNYEVIITDGTKKKTLIVHPVHLKKV